MIPRADVQRLLDAGAIVRLHSGSDRTDTVAVGRMVGYSPNPMVCIVTPDGSRKWWVADIAEVVDPGTAVGSDEIAEVLDGTSVRRAPARPSRRSITANTWQSAARRLADENRRLLAKVARVRALAETFARQDYEQWHGDELAALLREALSDPRPVDEPGGHGDPAGPQGGS